MATMRLLDEPSFCIEVRPKHIQNRFQLLKICPRHFIEHNFEKFGLNKEYITLSSNEHPQIFLDGLEDFFDYHKIKVNDRVCFQVDSKVQSHLHISIHRHTGVSLVTTKIENIVPLSQCTTVAAIPPTPASPIPLAGGGDSMPRSRDAMLGGGDSMPRSGDAMLGGENSMPGGGDSMHGGGDSVHGSEDFVHGGGDFVHGGGDFVHGGGDFVHGGGDFVHGDGDSMHGGGDALPGSEDSMHGGGDAMPGSEDSMHGGGDAMPGSEDSMPGGGCSMPRGDDSMPGGGYFMPRGEDSMLGGSNPVCGSGDSLLGGGGSNPVCGSGDSLPGGGEYMPSVVKTLAFIQPITPTTPSVMTPLDSHSVMTQSSPLVVAPFVSLPMTMPLASSLSTPLVGTSHLELPLVVTPCVPSMPSASTRMKNVVRSRGKKRSMECHLDKAQEPQLRSLERTRLASGVLHKINYCEDVPLERSMKNANVNEANLREVQAHKKRVKAGCTLVEHLNLLPQAVEGATCDTSAEDVNEQLSIMIERNPTCPLAIRYWMNQAFLEKYRRLLEICYEKDVLLINQFGLKFPVRWNPYPKEVDHTTTGWGAFVAANNLHDGDQCNLKVVHTTPIEFKLSFIRKPGSKPPGSRMISLLKNKPKEKFALEGLERGYGSEGDAIALDNRQHQYRSHFRFQADLSDNGKFHYSSDCPGTYARITPYPKRSRSGKRFQPFKKSQLLCKQSQPGTSFVLAPGLAVQEHIIQEFLKATPSTLVTETNPKPKRGRPRKRA